MLRACFATSHIFIWTRLNGSWYTPVLRRVKRSPAAVQSIGHLSRVHLSAGSQALFVDAVRKVCRGLDSPLERVSENPIADAMACLEE